MSRGGVSGPIDVIVGANIRRCRVEAGLSQSALAHRLGISFQQLQKYETGTNRIAAGRLWQIAALIGRPVGDFFAGCGSPAVVESPPPATAQAVTLLRAWQRLPGPMRRAVFRLVTAAVRSVPQAGDVPSCDDPAETGLPPEGRRSHDARAHRPGLTGPAPEEP